MIEDDYDGPDFTCITFSPDWKRFHMTGLEADTVALLKKVCYVLFVLVLHVLGPALVLAVASSFVGAVVAVAVFSCLVWSRGRYDAMPSGHSTRTTTSTAV